MAFGKDKDEERPTRMTWKATDKSARAICDWARDDALIPFAAVTPPDRNAPAGTPAAEYRLKLMVAVPAAMGGGTQWIDVPKGATILDDIQAGSTRVDPVFKILPPETPRAAASTFTQTRE